jgi:hypothetical protein
MDGGFGGFGKKAAAGQGAAAAGAAAAGATEDYDLAARELFARLNLPASGDAGAAAQDRYANLDAIWSDPQTKAKVFIGNQTAAKSQPTLEANGITHIINCQDVSAPNFHEANSSFHCEQRARVSERTLLAKDESAALTPGRVYVCRRSALSSRPLVQGGAGQRRGGARLLPALPRVDPRGAVRW